MAEDNEESQQEKKQRKIISIDSDKKNKRSDH